MEAMDWNKKEELVADQARRHLKVQPSSMIFIITCQESSKPSQNQKMVTKLLTFTFVRYQYKVLVRLLVKFSVHIDERVQPLISLNLKSL